MPIEVTEHYPQKLPPLRPDAPTLVVGRIKPCARLAYQIEGRLPNRFEPMVVNAAEAVRADELDNYFLVSMVGQWKRASDEPALIRADLALAFAFEQNRLNHLELIASGQLAVRENQLAVAEQLFDQAKQLAPHDVQAKAGLKIIDDLRAKRLTPEIFRQQLNKHKVDRAEKVKGALQWNADFVELAQLDPQNADRAEPPPQVNREDLLQQERDRLIIEEQRLTQTGDSRELGDWRSAERCGANRDGTVRQRGLVRAAANAGRRRLPGQQSFADESAHLLGRTGVFRRIRDRFTPQLGSAAPQ